MISLDTEWLYRYNYTISKGVPHITLRKLFIIRTTPEGVMVTGTPDRPIHRDIFIPYKSKIPFAYPTIEEAREAFIKRQQSTITKAELAIAAMKDRQEPFVGLC